uniref:Uncharacterized protein n=1 Tax=Arundo donax TaxID=35708 RepID=A0A0A9ABJ4_ARUDO
MKLCLAYKNDVNFVFVWFYWFSKSGVMLGIQIFC